MLQKYEFDIELQLINVRFVKIEIRAESELEARLIAANAAPEKAQEIYGPYDEVEVEQVRLISPENN